MIDRTPREDGFVVSPGHHGHVKRRNVLVVEDTWVSGAKAQSVAMALKDAGASNVIVLALGRWLRYDWNDHKTFIEELHEPYDALVCPVTDDRCPD
jgi:phosphoribosylpyrophosphate synthetase